jgi:uncharacterized protein (TIGR03435 family)
MSLPARMLPLVLSAAIAALAQSQTAPVYKFAVVSVKPNTSAPRPGGIGFQPGGRFQARNFPLIFVIALAYNVPFQSTRLTGGPDWLRIDRFDIDAVADKDALPPGLPDSVRKERLRAMLRALLADRFQLVVRAETKEISVYAEVVGKNGLKLLKSAITEKDCDDSTCHIFMGGRGRGMHSKAADLTDLAQYVSNWTDLPVVDETGVKGLFQIDTKPWISDDSKLPSPGEKAEDGSDLADLTTVFTVFTEVGLRLERRKAPMEMYTIEKVSKPAEN